MIIDSLINVKLCEVVNGILECVINIADFGYF